MYARYMMLDTTKDKESVLSLNNDTLYNSMITIVFIYLSVIVLNAIKFRQKGLVHNKLPAIPILMF